MRYRREVDGLRAVAVVPVILYHLGYGVFGAGFLGVDIFFVISGFLITLILLEEKKNASFSIINFYDRRARRILPALFAVIALSALAAWFIMIPSQIEEFGESVIAALGFSANIYFWLKLNYWSQSAELIPLLHIWSLGIEEQFYVIFPLLLFLIRSHRTLKVATVLLAIASFAGMVAAHQHGRVSEAFYLLPFRAWELAVGSCSAMLVFENRLRPSAAVANSLSWLALTALMFSLIAFDGNTPVGLLHATPVLATALILLFASGQTQAGRLLGVPPLVWIGMASYSLYLVHQPILAFARLALGGELNEAQRLLCLAATAMAGYLSYRWVEMPFRTKAMARSPRFYLGLIGVAVVIGLFGFAAHKAQGFKSYKLEHMNPAEVALITRLDAEKETRRQVWRTHLQHAATDFDTDSRTRILFVGDSISEDLYVAASTAPTLASDYQMRRLPLDDSCIQSRGESGVGKEYPTCREELAAFLDAAALRHADVVVLGESWGVTDADAIVNFLDLEAVRHKKIVLFNQHFFVDMTSLLMGMDKFDFDLDAPDLQRYIYTSRHQRTMMANRIIERIARQRGLPVIRGFSFFCNDQAAACRLFDRAGTPLIIDQHHLSNAGLKLFSPWFAKQLQQAVQHDRDEMK